jgi:predicted RNA-binding Zn-ribbon protein involved in translation (DUF1610 family)
VRVKCVECGKEFEIEEGESPFDFQCECGGSLSPEIEIKSTVRKNKEAGICKNCGTLLVEHANTCPKCGFRY